MITTAVLVTGLVAVAAAFSYTARTNTTTEQRTTGTILLYEKMEQFKSTPLTDVRWTAGGDLNPSSPDSGYFDQVTMAGLEYTRLWQITGAMPRSITVVVFAREAGLTRQPMELVRATVMMTKTF